MSTMPRVVLVGRTNVGKSTLFNRLSVNVKSITLDYEGVTRDFIKDEVSWKGRTFELVDTGGVSLRKTTDPILQKVREKALEVMERSDIILFVCDGKVGVVPEDREISKLLHKTGKQVILVVNKVDSAAGADLLFEFEPLGHTPVIPVSAQHGSNIADVLGAIIDWLPKTSKNQTQEKPAYKVILLGKPNVGKSSLMNLLLKQDRSIVSEQAGTTREPISEKVSFYAEDLLVTDTPGIRRQRSVKEKIESLMVKGSLRALDNADIVLLLIDSSEATLADQELKLAFYAFEEKYKAVIILFNKQDLMTDEYQHIRLESSLAEYEFFIKKIVHMPISCVTGKNIGKVFPLVHKIWERYSQQFSNQELTMYLKSELDKKPLYHKTIPLLLYRVEQMSYGPITIGLEVNHPQWFGPTQLNFFENKLREKYDLQGVPVKFIVRSSR